MNPKELLNELVGWLKDTVEGSIKKLFEDNTNKIVDSINSQDKTNPQDITNPINNKLDEVKDSVEGLEFPEYPKQIDNRENINELGEKLELLIGEIEKLNPNVTINNDFKELIDVIIKSNDKTKVVNTLSLIKKELENKNDYMNILEEISSKIEESNDSELLIEKLSKLENLGIIIEYLQALLEKPIPSFEEYVKDGRIKVEVDRVGQGGGGGIAGSYNKDLEQINPATEEKQDDQISNQGDILQELSDILEQVSPATSLEGGGKISIGTTPVEMTFTTSPKTIILTGDQGNNDIIYWGGSNIDSNGNNAMVYLEANNVQEIHFDDTTEAIYVVANSGRSEERRVGKECRYRWSPYH